MRRGHPSVGGWRGENQRHFRPRGNGPPNFRASRPFGLLDSPRFPPPGPRQFRGPRPFVAHSVHPDNVPQSDHHDRNKYRVNNAPRSQDRFNRDRQMPPFNHPRQNDNDYSETNFYNNSNQCRVNKMGDVDHRRQQSPWSIPSVFDNNRQYYEEHRSPNKTTKFFNMGDEMIPDYSGHRPPASDHYTTTTGPNNINSQYTHSVDDTVDIIRKRLQNRDKQPNLDLITPDHQSNMDEDLRIPTKESCQEVPQEQPVKKRIQRQKQNIKTNCDKMKNKIVHQLFKMDKVKIHKLMDNPSSSTKFEYAISSLITEGQNSLNKHLRSVAEKSLSSSSTDFIQDDSHTIYEDTFMKQMQGILDPQDTILLEDIKPIVMAELSRVLQLDDYHLEAMQDHTIQDHGLHDYEIQNQYMEEQRYEMQDTETFPKNEPDSYPYYEEPCNPDQLTQDLFSSQNQSTVNSYNNTEVVISDIDDRHFEYNQPTYEEKPLFERRAPSRTTHIRDRSLERQLRNSQEQSRSSMENTFPYGQESSDCTRDRPQTIPLFDPNVDQLSDDDDAFAELDKQYHVAVDHNFISNDYASRPPSPQSFTNNQDKTTPAKSIETPYNGSNSTSVKKEIDAQLLDIAKSPVKLYAGNHREAESKVKINVELNKPPEQSLEKENISSVQPIQPSVEVHAASEPAKKKETKKEAFKVDVSAITKSILQSNSRKRSTDQKPSHRKEKRKRSSQSECHDVAKSIVNMLYTNEVPANLPKVKRSDSTDKAYSDKYVKRKEPHKKAKDKEKDHDVSKTGESKKLNNSSNISTPNLKDNIGSETPKSDSKVKLKPIDMFGEQTKKGNTQQIHKNTATPQAIVKSPDDSNPKAVIPVVTSFARKLSKRHIGTQVILKSSSKASQTNKANKLCYKQSQTDPVSIGITKKEVSNPLERMKEIDMEIQLLLQEKFKLYNSLETKSMSVPIDTIPSLSMRVFNVNTEEVDEEKSNDSADAIVSEFTSIPTDELEQIAFESLAEEKPHKSSKKNNRQKVLKNERKSSESPSRKLLKKMKSPNISLIEQIITDDRPLEDIISLDDLESTPQTKKKLNQLPKKKSLKKPKSSKSIMSRLAYDIKECSVLLERIDLSKFLLKIKSDSLSKASKVYIIKSEQVSNTFTYEVPVIDLGDDSNIDAKSEDSEIVEIVQNKEDREESVEQPNLVQVVEEVVNDLQFDMLDVSEDIVIGDNCEVKVDGKTNEREVISEEIILDNSQSSLEEGTVETASSENECKMYDYSTNDVLRRDAITVTGNADAVLAVECVNNDFIAACLDGNVYHFNSDGQLLNTLRGTNQAVTCLTIVKEKYGTTVYTGSLDSRIRYYDLETGMEKGPECNVLSPIQTMDRAWDTVFVGTRTGFVLQFECKNNMLIPVSTVKFSEQSILALRAMKEGPRKVLLVAARSENVVTVKDAQTGLLLRTLQGPKMSVYTLLFEDGKVYCGTSSHNIHVFDYTSGGHVGSHEGGKGAVCLRASGGLLFAGCYDGCVYVYREGEPRPLAQIRGPSLMLLSLAIHGTKIIAGYKDRGLYIWKMPLAIVQEMIL